MPVRIGSPSITRNVLEGWLLSGPAWRLAAAVVWPWRRTRRETWARVEWERGQQPPLP